MVTESMRAEYRSALIRGGVPEVYAHMAAKELAGKFKRAYVRQRVASDLLWCGFVWEGTEQGHAFWSGIAQEADLAPTQA